MPWVLIILFVGVLIFGYIDGAFKKDIFDKKDFLNAYKKKNRK